MGAFRIRRISRRLVVVWAAVGGMAGVAGGATLNVFGTAGTPGGPGLAGGAGGLGLGTLTVVPPPDIDPLVRVEASGGVGGAGGDGTAVFPLNNGGNGGAGGAGSATASLRTLVLGSIRAEAFSFGGAGGQGGLPGLGGVAGGTGANGSATALAQAESQRISGRVDARAEASGGGLQLLPAPGSTGGNGGNGTASAITFVPRGGFGFSLARGFGGPGQGVETAGNGGNGGTGTAYAESRADAITPPGSRSVGLLAEGNGGVGGEGRGVGFSGGLGGLGAISGFGVSLSGAPAGTSNVSLRVFNGAGGTGLLGAAGGDSQDANFSLISTLPGTSANYVQEAIVGRGGSTFDTNFSPGPLVGPAGNGGDATVNANVSVPGGGLSSTAQAYAGGGGDRNGTGSGGAAGDAFVTHAVQGASSAFASSNAVAGNGGTGGGIDYSTITPTIFLGNGAPGGTASVVATTTAPSTFLVSHNASAFGGTGGSAFGVGAVAGDGGNALVSDPAHIAGSRNLTHDRIGGGGGAGLEGANGGNGRSISSITSFVDAVGLPGSVAVSQGSFAGSAGPSGGGVPGLPGDAVSEYSYTTLADVSVDVTTTANGGFGGSGLFTALGLPVSNGLAGGTARAASSVSSTGQASAYTYSNGGSGGAGEVGANGTVPDPTSFSFARSHARNANAILSALGGTGGDAVVFGSPGFSGAGASVSLFNRVAVDPGTDQFGYLGQAATGGNSGSAANGNIGAAGTAESKLDITALDYEPLLETASFGGNAGSNLADLPTAAANGGDASSDTIGRSAVRFVTANANSRGGQGSNGGQIGGIGGDASSRSNAIAIAPGVGAFAYSEAFGGDGGIPSELVPLRQAGGGGDAFADAVAEGTPTSVSVVANAFARGGNQIRSGGGESRGLGVFGYDPYFPLPFAGGAGGSGLAQAQTLSGLSPNAVANATGGDGSPGLPDGRGGDASAESLMSVAVGGNGSASAFANGGRPAGAGRGGKAEARAETLLSGSIDQFSAEAVSFGGLLTSSARLTTFSSAPTSIYANSESDEDAPLPPAILSGVDSGALLKSLPTAAQAAASYSGFTNVSTTFGDGSGVLAMGFLSLEDTASTSPVRASITLSGESLRGFDNVPLYVGVFGVAGGLSPTGIATLFLERNFGLVAVETANFTTGLPAVFGDRVFNVYTPGVDSEPDQLNLMFEVDITGSASLSFVIGAAPIPNQWRSGIGVPEWGDTANWTGNVVPDAPGAVAIFNHRFVQPSQVLLSADRTVGEITLDGPLGFFGSSNLFWRFLGDASAKLDIDSGGPGAGRVVASTASAQFDLPLQLVSDVEFSIDLDRYVELTAGTLGSGKLVKTSAGVLAITNAPAGHSGGTQIDEGGVFVDFTGALPFNDVVVNNGIGGTANIINTTHGLELYSNNQVDSLLGTGTTRLGSFVTLNVSRTPQTLGSPLPGLAVEQSLLTLDQGAVLGILESASTPAGVRNAEPMTVKVDLIELANDGAPLGTRFYYSFIDLADSNLVTALMPLEDIRDMIRSWYSNGVPQSAGLGSRLATTGTDNHRYATLGALSNTDEFGLVRFLSLGNVPLSPTDVIVKYTYLGDTNLDGLLDASDFNAVLNGITNSLTGWEHGDVNYDGVADLSDWAVFLDAYAYYLTSGTPFSGAIAPAGSIPEPISLGAAAGLAVLLGRRRR
jgi:hypothetical protein